MTTPYYRQPSSDRAEPEIRECPNCGYPNPEVIAGRIDVQIECFACKTRGPDRADYVLAAESWNSIPRRSEVAELLRLVDEVTSRMEYEELERYATQMRQEWGI